MISCTVYLEKSNPLLIIPFIFHFLFRRTSSAFIGARAFKCCKNDEDNQVCYWIQNKGAEIYFAFFLYFPFSISHSNVMNMEIVVKDFTGTS